MFQAPRDVRGLWRFSLALSIATYFILSLNHLYVEVWICFFELTIAALDSIISMQYTRYVCT